MIISFTGCQSSGKSTLLTECEKHYGNVFHYVTEVTRAVKDTYDVPINSNAGNLTQLLILNQHLNNSRLHPTALHCGNSRGVLMDRCILDGVIYTGYLAAERKVDKWVHDYAIGLFGYLIDSIDLLIYPDPKDVPLIDDGVRSIDLEFRNIIIASFEGWLQLPKLKNKVLRVSGTVEERMEQIKKAIG